MLKQEAQPQLRQEQWLKMQMIQLMRILPLPALELHQWLRQEMEENPLLELKETKDEGIEEMERRERDNAENILTYLQDSPRLSPYPGRQLSKSISQVMEENLPAEEASLHNYLLEQATFRLRNHREYKIGEFIIGNIDDQGYLHIDIGAAAKTLKIEPEEITTVIKKIQDFDPTGIGSRNLKEYLLIQCRQANLKGPDLKLAEEIINKYLEDLAQGKFHKIAHELGCPQEKLKEISNIIKSFKPRPAQEYRSPRRRICPEIIIRKEGNDYQVSIDEAMLPSLRINPLYQQMLGNAANGADKEYIRKKLNAALLIIKSLHQRKILLRKIVERLLKIQRPFLDKGIDYLQPLNIEEVARLENVHPSTISRAVASKYVQTPEGIFPLKFFFSAARKGNSNAPALKVKNKIAGYIAKEDKKRPLSDQKMAHLLKEEGIRLSRRVIAKYRQVMGIPSSLSRKV